MRLVALVFCFLMPLLPASARGQDERSNSLPRTLDFQTAISVFMVKWACGGDHVSDLASFEEELRAFPDQRLAELYLNGLTAIKERVEADSLRLKEVFMLPPGRRLQKEDEDMICEVALRIPNVDEGKAETGISGSDLWGNWSAIPELLAVLENVELPVGKTD